MQVDCLNQKHHDYKLQNNAGLGSIAVSIKVPHKEGSRVWQVSVEDEWGHL